jgi:hypothetical protein
LAMLAHAFPAVLAAQALSRAWGGIRGVGSFRTGCGRSRSR